MNFNKMSLKQIIRDVWEWPDAAGFRQSRLSVEAKHFYVTYHRGKETKVDYEWDVYEDEWGKKSILGVCPKCNATIMLREGNRKYLLNEESGIFSTMESFGCDYCHIRYRVEENHLFEVE